MKDPDFFFFFAAGAVSAMVLMLAIYRWAGGKLLPKDKIIAFVIVLVMAVSAIGAGVYFKSTQPSAEPGAVPATREVDPMKSKYLGVWKAPRGKASIEIYEENGGIFAKFWQGDIMLLTFQQQGQYYEGSTALGAMPLIIRNDTLQYSQSKYIRTQD